MALTWFQPSWILTQPAYCSGAPNEESKTIQIGSIDYFGCAGLHLKQVEDHLPIRVGDWMSFDSFDHEKEMIQRFAKQFTGKPATDIAAVCCDKAHRLQIYIGLSGTSSRSLAHNPAPRSMLQEFATNHKGKTRQSPA